jgi:3-oxoacyl-ACP reductase-like protein
MNNRTLFTELDGLDGRPEAPPAPVSVAIVLIAVMLLALAGIIRLAQLRGSGELLARFVAPPATAGDYAYYTDRYWQAAAAREAVRGAGRQASAGMSEGEMYRELYTQHVAEQRALLAKPPALYVAEPATYTDRYWQMAAAREANLQATSAALGAPATTAYGTYTDRYWQMASEREARLN